MFRSHQNAAARHRRLGSLQILTDVVDQRGGGDLEAVGVGPIREQREGLSQLQRQDLRQRDLLQGDRQLSGQEDRGRDGL